MNIGPKKLGARSRFVSTVHRKQHQGERNDLFLKILKLEACGSPGLVLQIPTSFLNIGN